MIKFPNCKINLGLNIVEKRADGYHNLETVFYPLKNLCDALEIVPSGDGKTRLYESGDTAVSVEQEKNLVIKALRLLEQEVGREFGQSVFLEKQIPSGAGLGGGSADASFMLMMLNEEFKLGISEAKLIELASTLGADCPFFIKNKAVYAEGIGERMEEIELDLSDKHFVVAKPKIHVSTKEAFAGIVPKRPELNVKEIVKRPISEWKELLRNDFEETIFRIHPKIGEIKAELYAQGAIYAQMSGSGSAVFGIFEKETKLRINSCETKIYYV